MNPCHLQRLVVRLDRQNAVERWVGTPQSDQVDDATDDRALQLCVDLVEAVVVAVDVAALARARYGQMIVGAAEKADVVDLRNALGEELDRAGGDVLFLIAT